MSSESSVGIAEWGDGITALVIRHEEGELEYVGGRSVCGRICVIICVVVGAILCEYR